MPLDVDGERPSVLSDGERAIAEQLIEEVDRFNLEATGIRDSRIA